jgi:tight adherence protein C
MNLLYIAIFVAVDLFVILALVVVSLVDSPSPAQVRLAEIAAVPGGSDHRSLRDFFSIISRPLETLRRPLRLKSDDDLIFRLTVAGYRDPGAADIFLNAKLLCPILGVLLATFTGSGNVLLFSFAFGAAGYFAPDVFLMIATSKRKKAIQLALPNALDLLVISMEAGLGMDQAVIRVSNELSLASPDLSEEMLILAREQRAGKPRTEAWKSMAERVDLDSVRQFSGMLTQNERLGTPIARALSQFADTLRAKRLSDAEERAAKTTVKLIFPLVLFIFPAMFVVILGPPAITLIKAFEDMGR